MPQKTQGNKSSYGSSPYWANWGNLCALFPKRLRVWNKTKSKWKDAPLSEWATLCLLAPLPPHSQVLISLLGSLFPPFSKLVVHVRYLCMYLYIYTVYVIVEYEMWLLHFIFEGLFVYFFQNCRKRCYIKTDEMVVTVKKEMIKNFLEVTRKRKREQ